MGDKNKPKKEGNNSVDESDRKMIGAVEKVEACGAKSLMGMMQPVPEMTQNRWKASVHQSTSDEKLLPVKTEKGKEAFSMADLMGSTPLKKNKDDMCLADLMAANGGSKSQNNSVHSEKDLQTASAEFSVGSSNEPALPLPPMKPVEANFNAIHGKADKNDKDKLKIKKK